MIELPPGWTIAPIRDLCLVNPRQFDETPDDADLISMVPMAAVEAETGRLDGSQQVRYGDIRHKSLTPFQEGDVIFAKITPCMENGKIAVARNLCGGRAVGSTEFFVLRPLGSLIPEYLMHFLLQKNYRLQAERNMTGAVGQRRVPRSFLEETAIPVPPLAEQRRIVTTLEDHLSRLDTSSSHISQAHKRSTFLASSIRNAIVNDPTAEQLPLGELIIRIEAGKSFAAEPRPANPNEWGIIKVSAMTWGEFKEQENKAVPPDRIIDPRFEIKPGDILLSRANTEKYVGASVLVRQTRPKLLLSDKSLRIVPKDNIDREWLIQVLSSPLVRRQIAARATGTKDAMRNISQEELKKIRVPYVTPKKQREIATKVKSVLDTIYRLDDQMRRAKEKGDSLRRSLLEAAFTGRLVPQNPKDEPASVLLERIKAERAAQGKPKRARRATAKTLKTTTRPVQESLL